MPLLKFLPELASAMLWACIKGSVSKAHLQISRTWLLDEKCLVEMVWEEKCCRRSLAELVGCGYLKGNVFLCLVSFMTVVGVSPCPKGPSVMKFVTRRLLWRWVQVVNAVVSMVNEVWGSGWSSRWGSKIQARGSILWLGRVGIGLRLFDGLVEQTVR